MILVSNGQDSQKRLEELSFECGSMYPVRAVEKY
jgi:hypothetical protein